MAVFTARSDGQGYQTNGPPAFHSGGSGHSDIFVQWEWDGSRLVVENDDWGIRPAFVATAPGAIWVGTSIVELLDAGAPAAIDDGAMAVFLRAGFFVGDDTPFLAIRALPAAARGVWTAGTLTLESGGQTPPALGLSRRD